MTRPRLLERHADDARRSSTFAETAAQTVPPEERVAVFDNDGTLWCEKPMPVELGFILERLAEMAEEDASLRERQPWKAAYEKDYAWLGGVIDKHYAGDDSDVKVLMGGMLAAFAGQTVDDYARGRRGVPRRGAAPDARARGSATAAYVPMVELLRYLEANGFTCYIASGGSRDFMRAVTGRDLRRSRPSGSSAARTGSAYADDEHGGSLAYLAAAGRVRRRPGEAGADLEPDRPAADRRRRQLERRRPDAPLRGRQRIGRRCACSSCTTTPSASSTT